MRTSSRYQREYHEAVTQLRAVCARAGKHDQLPPAVYDELVTARLKLWMVRERMGEEAEARARKEATGKRQLSQGPGVPAPRYRPRRTVRRRAFDQSDDPSALGIGTYGEQDRQLKSDEKIAD